MRKIVCRLLGHTWSNSSLACRRCAITKEQLDTGLNPAKAKELGDSYWRGVEDGRKIDRRRIYEIGYRRGARAVLGELQQWR